MEWLNVIFEPLGTRVKLVSICLTKVVASYKKRFLHRRCMVKGSLWLHNWTLVPSKGFARTVNCLLVLRDTFFCGFFLGNRPRDIEPASKIRALCFQDLQFRFLFDREHELFRYAIIQ